MLIENNEFLLENKKAVDVFNSYSLTITESLDLLEWFHESDKDTFGNIENIMKKIAAHQEKFKTANKFSFNVTEDLVRSIVNVMSTNKVSSGDKTVKLLKESGFAFTYFANCIQKQSSGGVL